MKSVEKKVYLGLLVCFLVSMIGVSFAYFTTGAASITGSGGSTNLTTATSGDMVHVKYDAGTAILNLEDAIPGDKASKDFTITITPAPRQNVAKYAIQLVISENTFVACSDDTCDRDLQELVYTLKDGTGAVVGTGNLIGATGTVTLATASQTVDTETPFSYKLEISFANSSKPQNHNMNKSFNGLVKVVFAE